MRTTKHILLTLSAVTLVLATACNDMLDLQPDGRIQREEIFKNRNNVRAYLNSIYTYGPQLNLEHSNYSDECEPAQLNDGSNSNFANWASGTVTPINFSTVSKDGDPWGDYYQGIRKCNIFLSGISGYDGLAYGNEKSNWEAQARTLRAFYYLQLIKRYGSVPYYTEEYTADRNGSNDQKSSFSQVAKNIIPECRLALAVPDDNDIHSFSWQIYENRFGIMHRAVVYAIMSEAALYAASPLYADGTITWDDAAAITGEALAECLQHDYKLFDKAPEDGATYNAYAYYFTVSSNDRRMTDKETIFQYSSNYVVWQNSGLPTIQGQVSAGACPTQNLVDCYEMQQTGEIPILGYSDANKLQPIINPKATDYDPRDMYSGRDPRFYASIFYNGAPRRPHDDNGAKVETFVGGAEGISGSNRRFTRTGYYMRKLNNCNSGENGSYDGALRSYRLAGLYLNFAEAALNATQSGYAKIDIGGGMQMSAADAINKIRERASMPPLPENLEFAEFEKRYRNERRVELAFEGHRYYDVRRWKILAETDGKITGMRITQGSGSTGLEYERFLVNDRKCNTDKFLLYPINQTEVAKIERQTGQNWQNPNW